MKTCESLAGRPLDEDLTVIVLIESCVKELRGKLDMPSKSMSYKRGGLSGGLFDVVVKGNERLHRIARRMEEKAG